MRVLNFCSSDVSFLGKGEVIKTFPSVREEYINQGLVYDYQLDLYTTSSEKESNLEIDYFISDYLNSKTSERGCLELVDFYDEKFVRNSKNIIAIPAKPVIRDNKILYTSIIVLY